MSVSGQSRALRLRSGGTLVVYLQDVSFMHFDEDERRLVMTKKTYDSTIARMAGNIVGALISERNERGGWTIPRDAIIESVRVARAIVAEVERTEPAEARGAESAS